MSLELVPFRLPDFYLLRWMHEHEDVQREIVANPKETAKLHGDDEDDSDPHLRVSGNPKADHDHDDIADAIENAVAHIALCNSRLAVAVDDERRIFEKLPASLDNHRDDQAIAGRKLFAKTRWQETNNEPQKCIEQHAVDDMRERIRIRHPLRILTSPHIPIPPAKMTVGSERRTPVVEFDCGDGEEDEESGEDGEAVGAEETYNCVHVINNIYLIIKSSQPFIEELYEYALFELIFHPFGLLTAIPPKSFLFLSHL